jgi:DtxR family Mn-dependent transcriptional regulator
MLSESVQNYLKTIYKLCEHGDRVNTNTLAEKLAISPASVSGMIKKLAEMKLVEYEPYQGFYLTPTGIKMALEIVRHHRLIELYLMQAMGYSWDQVHDEAERLEHAISEDFEDRISELLGNPKHDPHGDPIPAKDGTVESASRRKLSEVARGESVVVVRVVDDNSKNLKELAHLGLMPRVSIKVVSNEPEQALIEFVSNDVAQDKELLLQINRHLAEQVFVK